MQFQQERQGRLNELETAVLLHLHQVSSLHHLLSGPLGGGVDQKVSILPRVGALHQPLCALSLSEVLGWTLVVHTDQMHASSISWCLPG